jgi:ribosomal protein L11 methyltransferase
VDDLESAILELVDTSRARLTPQRLRKMVSADLAVPRSAAHQAIQVLIAKGLLTYTYQFGCSFIEKSFQKPVRLSRHIIVKPPGVSCIHGDQDIVIELAVGAAFGSGQHPTTRLALNGIEYILRELKPFQAACTASFLDIGAGSGILALAALKLGMTQGVGLDIDPCAIAECKANAQQNGLDKQLTVADKPLEELEEPFDLIMANLRLPTLCRIQAQLKRLLKRPCALIFSGFKVAELDALLACYRNEDFKLIWQASEKGWSAAAFAA